MQLPSDALPHPQPSLAPPPILQSKLPGYVFFRPSADKTPALRSSAIDPKQPYNFVLPAGGRWRELKARPAGRAIVRRFKPQSPGLQIRTQVANAISGNYCQPRCDEPTTEVLFQSGTQGKISLIISPLTKVTRLIEPSIDQAR